MAGKLNDLIILEIKESGVCTKEFAVKIDAAAAKSEADKVVSYIAGVASIPGFRPGKAPRGMVSKKYAAEINEELRNRFVGAAIEKIESDETLDLLSLRFKEFGEIKAGEEFSFTMEGVVAPEVDPGDYNNLKVDVPLDAVEDKAIEERLDMYRAMYGTYADAEGAAQAEDMLKVDYKGDFELPEDAGASLKRQIEAADAFMWLNEPENIPGCIKALTGAEVGKEYTFEAEYPADYREEALAGKKVNYTVKVSAIQRRKKLTDEELVERTGSKDLDTLRDNIRKGLELDAKNQQRRNASEAVFAKLNEQTNDFALPEALVENEVQKLVQQKAREVVKSEEDAEKFKAELADHRAAVEDDAKKSVRRALILRQIAKLEKISVDEQELDEQLQMMSRYYGCKPRELRDMLEKSGSIDELRMDIINGKVLEKLTETAIG
ncbi:MAG: trigger factor [Lentisphaerae bacterium]|nr:trigger factor [Lentisphaerota bacterium]